MAQEQIVLQDTIDTTTDEYQYRLICLKMAHMAQEVIGDLTLDTVIERADRYWEFIIGSDDEPEDFATEGSA